MNWSEFRKLHRHLPHESAFFNSIIDLIRVKLVPYTGGDKAVAIFYQQLDDLKLPPGACTRAVSETQWFKFVILLGKQWMLTMRGPAREALRAGMQEASATLCQRLGEQRVNYFQLAERKRLLREVSAKAEASDVEPRWQAQQRVVYMLLSVYQKARLSDNRHVQEVLARLERLIRFAVHANFLIVDAPGQENSSLLAPFYAELSALMVETREHAAFALLAQAKAITARQLFTGDAQQKHICQVVDVKNRWLTELKDMTLPPFWNMIVKTDASALDTVAGQLQSYMSHRRYSYTRPTAAWVSQLSNHILFVRSVWWPPLRRLLQRQIDECVRDVILPMRCPYADLVRIYEMMPKSARSAPLVFAMLIRSFSTATVDERIRLLRVVVHREKKYNVVNPAARFLLERLYTQRLTGDQRSVVDSIRNSHNAHIKHRNRGLRYWWRRRELVHQLNLETVQGFIKAFSRHDYKPDADIVREFKPLSADVSDQDYEQTLRAQTQGNSERGGLSMARQGQCVVFNKMTACFNTPAKQAALRATLPRGVLPADGVVSEDALASFQGCQAALRQSVAKMKSALDDKSSAFYQKDERENYGCVLTEAEVGQVRALLQHFDDLGQDEEEKTAILSDPSLSCFYSTLTRRLTGTWQLAHIVGTNDVNVRASRAVRGSAAALKVGGAMVSMPVVSGIIAGSGTALQMADEYRQELDYLKLAEALPTGTGVEVLAEWVARILTLRYAQQINGLSLDGVSTFAEYCFDKIKAGLLSQQGVREHLPFDLAEQAYAPEHARKSQRVYRHAYAIATIVTKPIDCKRFAVNMQPQLKMHQRLRLKPGPAMTAATAASQSSAFTRGNTWKAENALLLPDLVLMKRGEERTMYRSRYAAPLDANARALRSPYGAVHTPNPIEVSQCRALGPAGERETSGQTQAPELPVSMQRLLTLEATAQLALQTGRHAQQGLARIERGQLPTATSPLRDAPIPSEIRATVGLIMGSQVTDMKQLANMNRALADGLPDDAYDEALADYPQLAYSPENVDAGAAAVVPATPANSVAASAASAAPASMPLRTPAKRHSPVAAILSPPRTQGLTHPGARTPRTARHFVPTAATVDDGLKTPTTRRGAPPASMQTPLAALHPKLTGELVLVRICQLNKKLEPLAKAEEARLKEHQSLVARYQQRHAASARLMTPFTPSHDYVKLRNQLFNHILDYALFVCKGDPEQAFAYLNEICGYSKVFRDLIDEASDKLAAERAAAARLQAQDDRLHPPPPALADAVPATPLVIARV